MPQKNIIYQFISHRLEHILVWKCWNRDTSKFGCVSSKVIVSLLPHAEFGRNYRRALHFNRRTSEYKKIWYPKSGKNWLFGSLRISKKVYPRSPTLRRIPNWRQSAVRLAFKRRSKSINQNTNFQWPSPRMDFQLKLSGRAFLKWLIFKYRWCLGILFLGIS